jgi:hypothetical protein
MAKVLILFVWWYALMAIGGLGFGLLGDRRPFGEGFMRHPLMVFFVIVAAVLLVVRVALAKPVPEVIPERVLLTGCIIGAAGFLVGNWIGVHLLAMR